ncbi:MAG: NB-ARC domain-containing protein [Chloroflexota bacterium]
MSTAQPDFSDRQGILYEKILQAFRQRGEHSTASPLKELNLFRQVKQGRSQPDHQVTTQLLDEGLKHLDETKPEFATILRLRFVERMTGYQVAQKLDLAQTTVERKQREAIEKLASIFDEQERQAQQAHIAQFEERLEAPFYDQLFGIDNHLDKLSDVIVPGKDVYTLLIQGMGGIGKTSLADALIRRAIANNLFDDFAWVSARQSRFQMVGTIRPVDTPALTGEALIEALCQQLLPDAILPVPFSYKHALPLLQTRLKQIPHLIAVDNLETVIDVEVLLPTLQRLANPSKFLLTSRKNIQTEMAVYPFSVPELVQQDALHLVRHEAILRNLPDIANGDDDQLMPIFDTTGGNPLALKLVVGQSHIHSLHDVLDSLKEARGEAIEKLYLHIYRYAWDHLDDLSRRVLLAMPFVPEAGGDSALLAKVSGLDMSVLNNGLAKLVTLNLINRNGGLANSRYTIHSLTRTFLHKQVVSWQ